MEKPLGEDETHQEKVDYIHTIYGTEAYQDNEANNLATSASCNDGDLQNGAQCGIGRLKPTALQTCATIPLFVGVYSFNGLVTSSLIAYANSQVTAFERHFGFSSTETGLIIAANDIGFLSVVLFISFVAAKVHIPHFLGYFTLLFGMSGLLSALPYFLFGAPSPSSSKDVGSSSLSSMPFGKPSSAFTGQICDCINSTSLACDATNTTDRADNQNQESTARVNAGPALAILVVCMILQGVAKAPRSAFILTYVDANVEKVKTGFYIGVVITTSIIGPVLAYALGAVFSRVYVTLEKTDMHYQHPKWIGAWWLGYVVFGAASCMLALPLFCFPRRIKKSEPGERKETKTSPFHVYSFLSALGRLLINPVYVCNVLSTSTLYFALAGGMAFTPKYIENIFSFPAWKTNTALAGVLLGTACLGTYLGGYLTKRFKMGAMASIKFLMVVQFLTCTSIINVLLKCDQPYIYNSPGPRATTETGLPGCMDTCACDDDDYFPVCGDDGRTFFSPCHAGCLHAMNGSYTNCMCITRGTAMAGMCDYSCSMFNPFLVIMCFNSFFCSLSFIPNIVVDIRAVEERDKPLAMGLAAFMYSIIGFMLGPICFGKLVDTACIIWEHGCSGTGFCRLYDNDDFRWKLLGVQGASRFLALLLIVIAYISAKVIHKFDKVHPKNDRDTMAMPCGNESVVERLIA